MDNQNTNRVSYLTVCSEGSYLGKTNDSRFDLFRLNNVVYKVNRDNTDTVPVPDSLVEFLLGLE